MSDRNETLIFLHIPKTGGSTLSKILENHYSRDQTATFESPDIGRFKALYEEKRGQYRLIQGHLYFGLHRFIPRPSTYVTFLRRPVDRVVSFYYYARTTPDHYLYPQLTAERLDLKTALERELSPELRNEQTRLLAGDEWEDSERVLTRAALDQAKANLQRHFCVVGLQEEFDASLLLLHRAFNWPLPFYLKQNVTRERPPATSLDVETRRLIEEANSLDLELYEFARSLFTEQCRAAGPSFASELHDFRRLNGDYARWVPRFATSFRRLLQRLRYAMSFNR